MNAYVNEIYREVIERQHQRSPEDLFREMIVNGIIAADGRVTADRPPHKRWLEDKVVIGVRHGSDRVEKLICLLPVDDMLPDTEAGRCVVSREDAIRDLSSGQTYVTATEDEGGGYRKRAKLHVVDGTYLRTDANQTAADNLGELPEITTVAGRAV